MTDHEITALAREYAEKEYERMNLPTDCCEPATDDYEKFLRFLLRRYYLADKAKVDKVYKTATDGKGRYKDRPYLDNQSRYDGDIRYAIYTATAGTLERLFPEIAKEVE